MKSSASSRILFLWVLAAMALFSLHVWQYWDWAEDDAFISFRYASNLVEGQGLVFNSGERVEGFSNLGWVLIASLALFLGFDPLLAAKAISFLSGLVILVYSWKLTSRLNLKPTSLSAFSPLILAITPFISRHTTTGLETIPFSAALIVSFYHLWAKTSFKHRLPLVLFCLTSLILLRPEGFALVVLLLAPRFLGIWAHESTDSKRSLQLVFSKSELIALVFSMGVGFLLVAYRVAYYGDILPNTFYAKSSLNMRGAIDGFVYSFDFIRESGGAAVYGLFFAGMLFPQTRKPVGVAVALLVLFGAVVLSVGGDWMHLYRFYVPVYPIIIACAVSAAINLLPSLPSVLQPRPIFLGLAPLVVFSGVFLLDAYKVENQIRRDVLTYVKEGQYLTDAYFEAGTWIDENTPDNSVVAVSDIGIVGYEGRRTVLDMFGLTNPHISRQEGRQHFKSDSDYVLSQEPDYIILVSDSLGEYLRIPDRDLYANPLFPSSYQMVKTIPIGFRSEIVEIYSRFEDDR